MSAGLATSTVTPGSTAPELSVTTPVIVPCADASAGRRTADTNTVTIVANLPMLAPWVGCRTQPCVKWRRQYETSEAVSSVRAVSCGLYESRPSFARTAALLGPGAHPPTDRHCLPGCAAAWSGEIRWLHAIGMQLLASRRRGANVLHGSIRSLQLRDRFAHAQHPAAGRACDRIGADARLHDGSRLRPHGRSSGHSSTSQDARGRRLCAARRHACGP